MDKQEAMTIQRIKNVSWPNWLNEDLAKLKSNLETMRLIYHSKNKQDLTYMAIKRFFAVLKLPPRCKRAKFRQDFVFLCVQNLGLRALVTKTLH